jgi:hypothetical protein
MTRCSQANLEKECNQLLREANAGTPQKVRIATHLGLIQVVTLGKTIGFTTLTLTGYLFSLGVGCCSRNTAHAFDIAADKMWKGTCANVPILVTATVAQFRNLKS